MALSFGTGSGGLMGPFATGQPIAYPSSGKKKPLTITDMLFGKGTSASDFSLGIPEMTGGGNIAGKKPVMPHQTQVNTAKVDGSSAFLSQISGFGAALLSSIGGQPEATPATVQPVAYNPNLHMGGLDMKTLLMIGGAGVAIYFIAKKG